MPAFRWKWDHDAEGGHLHATKTCRAARPGAGGGRPGRPGRRPDRPGPPSGDRHLRPLRQRAASGRLHPDQPAALQGGGRGLVAGRRRGVSGVVGTIKLDPAPDRATGSFTLPYDFYTGLTVYATATWPDGTTTTNASWAIPVADCTAATTTTTTVAEPTTTTVAD